jgi:hypothetical protein
MANLIPNGSFTDGGIGQVPDGWGFERLNPALAPVVRSAREDGAPALVIEGCGDADCIGWLATYFPIECGETYRLSVSFRMSEEVDPNAHLLIATLDLSVSAAPHYGRGPVGAGPGGRRNLRGAAAVAAG